MELKISTLYNGSIRNRLILSFIAVIIIPIMLISSFSYSRLRENILSSYSKEAQFSMRAFDENLKMYFARIDNITMNFMFSPDMMRILEQPDISARARLENQWKFEEYSKTILNDNEYIAAIYFVSSVGTVYSKQNNAAPRYETMSEEQLQPFTKELKEQNGKFTIVGSQISRKGKYSLWVGRELKSGKSSQSTGYVLLEITHVMFDKLFLGQDKPTHNIMITQQDGQILFDLLDKNNIDRNLSTAYSGIDSNKNHITTHHIDELNLDLIMIEDVGNQVRTLNNVALTMLLFATICFLIFLALAAAISHHISKPIKQLQSSMDRAAKGDLHIRANRSGTYGEIENLTVDFNVMMDHIEHMVADMKKMQTNRIASDLKALQSQISPHFLYNALESINSLAIIYGVEDISEMILCMADVMKYNMDFRQAVTPLSNEINHIKNYCTLQAIAYQNRIKIEYNVPDTLMNVKVLPFILQPLVENAITHGLGDMEHSGLIHISAHTQHNSIWITVSDNGNGFSPASLAYLNRMLQMDIRPLSDYDISNQQIGIINVHLRLRMSFGEAYGVFLENGKTGAIVTIRLPLEDQPEGELS